MDWIISIDDFNARIQQQFFIWRLFRPEIKEAINNQWQFTDTNRYRHPLRFP